MAGLKITKTFCFSSDGLTCAPNQESAGTHRWMRPLLLHFLLRYGATWVRRRWICTVDV